MTRGATPRSALGNAVSAVLGLWLAVSALGQLGLQPVQWLRRMDFLGIVPVWTFFAPNPATGDVYLVYRDDAFRRWTEIRVRQPRRSWLATLWNPDRRAAKALFDISTQLSQISTAARDANSIQLSVPYLTLLEFVGSEAARQPAANATQFMLLSDHGLDKGSDPVPVFVSGWHSL
jgi:hypothetical protein